MQDAEHRKVYEQSTIQFVPNKESMKDTNKIEITLNNLPMTAEEGKNNVTNNNMAKFECSDPEELIKW
eukprot:13379619-Ditylum_brightwellii.AAC.1